MDLMREYYTITFIYLSSSQNMDTINLYSHMLTSQNMDTIILYSHILTSEDRRFTITLLVNVSCRFIGLGDRLIPSLSVYRSVVS